MADGVVLRDSRSVTASDVLFGTRLSRDLLGCLRTLPRVSEHGAQEIHVSVDRLLGESLGGLLLLALLLDEILSQSPVVLCLGL
jgi:hypothetical protein